MEGRCADNMLAIQANLNFVDFVIAPRRNGLDRVSRRQARGPRRENGPLAPRAVQTECIARSTSLHARAQPSTPCFDQIRNHRVRQAVGHAVVDELPSIKQTQALTQPQSIAVLRLR